MISLLNLYLLEDLSKIVLGDTIVVTTEDEKNSKYEIYDFESFGEVF